MISVLGFAKQSLGTTGGGAKRRFAGRIPKRRLGTTGLGAALGNDRVGGGAWERQVIGANRIRREGAAPCLFV